MECELRTLPPCCLAASHGHPCPHRATYYHPAISPTDRVSTAAALAVALGALMLLVGGAAGDSTVGNVSVAGAATGDVVTVGDGPGTATAATMEARGDGIFPYWIAGTAFPCNPLEDCTFLVNGTDAIGGDQVVVDNSKLSGPCIISSHLSISKNWYGYLATFRLRARGAKLYYRFSYPWEKCCIKILLYLEEQVDHLRYHMNCQQKQSLVDPTSPQVITLSPSYPSSGCVSRTDEQGKRWISCSGGRFLNSDIERKWYIAASSCGSPTGLDMEYMLVAYGYEGECPANKPIEETSGVASTHRTVRWVTPLLSAPSVGCAYCALCLSAFLSASRTLWLPL